MDETHQSTMKLPLFFSLSLLLLFLNLGIAVGAQSETDQGLANEYGNKNIFDSGNVYEGKLKDGIYYKGKLEKGIYVRDGKCKLTYVNGMVFEGRIKNDNFNGQEKMTYPKDPKRFKHTLYEGGWKDGYWHGKGILIFQDGRKYEGEFQYGQFLGKGKLTHPDGTVEEGTWMGEKLVSKDKKTKVTLRDFGLKYSEEDSRLYVVYSEDIRSGTFNINGVSRRACSYSNVPPGLNLLHISLDGADHPKKILVNVEPGKQYFLEITTELNALNPMVRQGTWDVDTGNLQVLVNEWGGWGCGDTYFSIGEILNSTSKKTIPIENLFTSKKGTRENISTSSWNRENPCSKCRKQTDTLSHQTSQDDLGYYCRDCMKKICFETTGTGLPLEKSKLKELAKGVMEAQKLAQASQFDKALEKINELFKIKPDEAALFYLKAVCLFNTGDLTGSEEAVKKGLGLDPIHVGLKDIQKRLDEENNPQSPSYHSREFSTLTKSFQDLIDGKKYQEVLDKAKAAEPNFPGKKGYFLFVYSNCYLGLNQLDQAKGFIKKSLEVEPNNEHYIALRKKLEFDLIGHCEKAEKLIEQKQFIQATAQLDEALSVFPSDAKTQYLKSICLENMEQKTLARLYILLALESDSNNETYQNQKEKVFQGDKEFVLNGTVESPEKSEWGEGGNVTSLDNLSQLMFIVTGKQHNYLKSIGITDAISKEAHAWNDKHKEEIEKASFYSFASGHG